MGTGLTLIFAILQQKFKGRPDKCYVSSSSSVATTSRVSSSNPCIHVGCLSSCHGQYVADEIFREQHSHSSDIELYLIYCNSQPLPLFPSGISPAALEKRDPELVAAMEALGIRFRGNGIKDSQIEAQIKHISQKACHMVMVRLASGTVELSTIQTLCLLSMLEFTGTWLNIRYVLGNAD